MILKCHREAPSIDKKVELRKRDMNWTISSLTYAVPEAKAHVASFCADWSAKMHYEVCLHVAKENPSVKIARMSSSRGSTKSVTSRAA